MMDFPSRFLTGMDTYPLGRGAGRWVEVPELAAEARSWLQQLPQDVAQAIAYGNTARLFPVQK